MKNGKLHTHAYKHVQVISNDIQDKQTADKQTTCSEPTNWLGACVVLDVVVEGGVAASWSVRMEDHPPCEVVGSDVDVIVE